jgi:hypothetical protein
MVEGKPNHSSMEDKLLSNQEMTSRLKKHHGEKGDVINNEENLAKQAAEINKHYGFGSEINPPKENEINRRMKEVEIKKRIEEMPVKKDDDRKVPLAA